MQEPNIVRLQLNKTFPIWTILNKMDKPGEQKWSSLFYETNISSQATVDERFCLGEKTLESFLSRVYASAKNASVDHRLSGTQLLRSHISPESDGALTCFQPSCSSIPAHVLLPTYKRQKVMIQTQRLSTVQLILRNNLKTF